MRALSSKQREKGVQTNGVMMTQVDPKEEKSRVPIHQFQSVCIYFLFWSFIIVIQIIFSAVTGLHLTQVSCMFIFSFSFAYALMTHAHVILPK